MGVKVTFDAATKRIICNYGVTELDVRVDLYSDAKEDWRTDATLNKFAFPFRVVGGDEVDPVEGTAITPHFFLLYGWRVRPHEASHNLTVKNGVLLVDGGGDPFVDTLGDYNVRIRYSQPIKTETLVLSGGSGLSTEEHDRLMATSLEATVDTVKADTVTVINDVGAVQTRIDNLNASAAQLNQAVLSLREGNVRRTLYLATQKDTPRCVAVGAIDREVIVTKADDAVDWSAPISTKTRYFWYRVMGDTEAYAIGPSSAGSQ